MTVFHISAECYPIAKVGGLADVVGALPKYQNRLGVESAVIMPFYNNSFSQTHDFVSVYNSVLALGNTNYDYSVLKVEDSVLDFTVYFIHVEDLLYKDFVYSEHDEDRFLAFQIAALDWLLTLDNKPNFIHCHDHHTGLIPFMLQESYKYSTLNKIPVITTIHNAQYQGWMSYDYLHKIPEFNIKHIGLLDWDGVINSLAAAIKCAWRVTTVSPSYMKELMQNANGLEALLSAEHAKAIGVLNGIDTEVWNPETDTFIIKNYKTSSVHAGKEANKKWLCSTYNLDAGKPLFAFIGRLVGEKGAEILPSVFYKALQFTDISILLLGSGNAKIETELVSLKSHFSGTYNAFIGYDETLSHRIYAGADFLLMPSRVEPCGLNQMYALRYGTVPIVRRIGGLKDTVIDINENGYGICHEDVSEASIIDAIKRAEAFYKKEDVFKRNRTQIMQIDNSWEVSAEAYINLYKSIQ